MAGLFEGKTAFVTGASSGIGAAVAEQFAREGAKVALAARREDRLDGVRKRIEDAGGKALAAPCDVCDRASLDAAMATTAEVFGGIDILVANAGFGVNGPFDRLKTEDFRRQFETNFFGVLDTIYAALPHLEKSRGTLAVVASVLGRIGSPNSSPYCASKFAVHGLCESLSYEFAPKGINVVCIQPGIVASEIRSVDNKGRFHPNHKDPAPAWLVVPTEKAAKDIVRAVHRGKFDAIITGHGKLAVWLKRHVPWVVAMLMRYSVRRKSDPMRRAGRPDAP